MRLCLLFVGFLIRDSSASLHYFQKDFHGKNESQVRYSSYTKQHPGRHVCTLQKNVTIPVKTKETYCKPVFQKYTERCQDNQMCTGVRLVYETSYKDITTTKTTKQISYFCCPGWSQSDNRSNGCTKPTCMGRCQNGGICVDPDTCKCLTGFTGQLCERDVNECVEQKPCDQICQNTFGSYTCECRENFALEPDGQTCRKDGDYPGLEAKELEYGMLDKRLQKLELMMVTEIPSRSLMAEIGKLSAYVNELSREFRELKEKYVGRKRVEV